MATPLVSTPPVSAVRARANRYTAARRRRNALVVSVVIGIGVTGITKLTMTPTVDSVRLVGDPGGPQSSPTSTTTTTAVVPTHVPELGAGSTFLPWSGQSFDSEWGNLYDERRSCPWAIGAANTALPTVKVAVHRPPRPLGLLGEPYPYDFVTRLISDFNQRSSICGRAIELVESTLETAPHDAVAVLGLPLDPAFDDAIADGRFTRVGLPVVGGDGLAAVEHESAMVYPVGTSAAALARTAAADALAAGASTFAVVHDATSRFGPEAAEALAAYVKRAGGTLKASIPVDPGLAVDRAKLDEFNRACAGGACDVVFLAMLPDTALHWLATDPEPAGLRMAALPTLLTSTFADGCFKAAAEQCNGLTAWSGFIPPFGPHADNFEAAYAWSAELDDTRKGSAMVEAAIVSARVLIEALLRAGPDITRPRVHAALQDLTFHSNVTTPLRWAQQVPRVGNAYAQAWRLVVEHAAQATGRSQEWAAAQADRQEGGVGVDSAPRLPGREWHDAGTGWRSDPQ